jgi:hypothetical protein
MVAILLQYGSVIEISMKKWFLKDLLLIINSSMLEIITSMKLSTSLP